jgi:hypothetical protein
LECHAPTGNSQSRNRLKFRAFRDDSIPDALLVALPGWGIPLSMANQVWEMCPADQATGRAMLMTKE